MTQVINIDELKSEAPVTVVVKGVEHHMVSATVDDFLKTIEDLEKLVAAPDMKEEIKLTVRMICRAFPTLKEEDVRQWPLPAIEKIFSVVRGADDSAKATEEDASGNAQPES